MEPRWDSAQRLSLKEGLALSLILWSFVSPLLSSFWLLLSEV